MTELSRRAVLSSGGRAAVATLSLGGVSVASQFPTSGKLNDDPIYAAIEVHERLNEESARLYDLLDEAESDARKEYGQRPWSLIEWRHYSSIGGSEIERARNEFLSWPDADPARVEREYLDAKSRERDGERAEREWDERAGITAQREHYERVIADFRDARIQLARTVPITPAGAAAALDHLRRDMEGCVIEASDGIALETIAAALRGMGGQANG